MTNNQNIQTNFYRKSYWKHGNSTHDVTPEIRVLIYYVGSKLGYKTNDGLEGERTSKAKSIGSIIKVHICIYSTKLQKFLENKRLTLIVQREIIDMINMLRTVMKTLSNYTLLRWKASIVSIKKIYLYVSVLYSYFILFFICESVTKYNGIKTIKIQNKDVKVAFCSYNLFNLEILCSMYRGIEFLYL